MTKKTASAPPDRPLKASAEKAANQRLDAFPDRIDLRDWYYQPALISLPDAYLACPLIPRSQILNQGQEGACTGFALAAVVNLLRTLQGHSARVSPRMLYELARRYDEWPGQDYDGSSARGAIKAWAKHGVCAESSWTYTQQGIQHMTDQVIAEAKLAPGGAYYRIRPYNVRDMHTALNETGILYATLMVHSGWARPGADKGHTVDVHVEGRKAPYRFPVIRRSGSADGGHAIAIVGYTPQGFVIQNSWGPDWGKDGFAFLPYEDFLMHATDVWVAQLGVPVTMDLWAEDKSIDTAGLQRASRSIPLADIRPYVIDVANNGELSDSGEYWTTPSDIERLFCETIPAQTRNWKKRRILLYLHGGLNSESASAKRIVAMRDVMLDNEIYPLHIMWESDFLSSVAGLFKDLFTEADKLAGGGFLENLTEARDRVLELTLARSGSRLWGEMKENAQLASDHPHQQGAIQLVAQHVELAKQKLTSHDKSGWELHIVGHSAGSIFAAHAMKLLAGLGIPLKSVQFMAPAIRTDDFKKLLLAGLEAGQTPLPSLYVLSDKLERGDSVGPYGKSLLYLVSNAFEGTREVPILGMKAFIDADRQLAKLFSGSVDGRPALVVSEGIPIDSAKADAAIQQGASVSHSHGGFDNDCATMNSVLVRVLDGAPKRLFTSRDLSY
ncbi:C1 family peptidase [Thiobacillus sp.]|uniref:C1 family peptidase n=1 Tax=Thiobacillus sp. TaxID=924 RepID=UPI0025FBB27F|nr:C1 family peptidase [Thiobacillus sp.]MBT9541334.1 C1 family peptidase [Thiobacillus sp.]